MRNAIDFVYEVRYDKDKMVWVVKCVATGDEASHHMLTFAFEDCFKMVER